MLMAAMYSQGRRPSVTLLKVSADAVYSCLNQREEEDLVGATPGRERVEFFKLTDPEADPKYWKDSGYEMEGYPEEGVICRA